MGERDDDEGRRSGPLPTDPAPARARARKLRLLERIATALDRPIADFFEPATEGEGPKDKTGSSGQG